MSSEEHGHMRPQPPARSVSAQNLVRVKMLQDWWKFKTGDVVEVSERHATDLLKHGWAEKA